MPPEIKTPKGTISLDAKGKAKLEFNTNFQPRFQGQYTKAQKFLDLEILRKSEPFIPLLTGVLIKSGILGTEIGSGLVQWITPYAKAQYYRPKNRKLINKILARTGISYADPGSSTGPLRGPLWFERMKQIHGEKIVKAARKIAGGG